MSFFTGKLTDQSRIQIITKGMKLDELLKDDILRELREKFAERGEIVTTNIQFRILETNTKKSLEVKPDQDKKEVILALTELDFVELKHPSPEHYKNSFVVITSNRNRTLETFLK